MNDGIRKPNHHFVPPNKVTDMGIDHQRMAKPVAGMLVDDSGTGD